MKKIFTLLVAVSCFTVSFAQHPRSYDPGNNRPDSRQRSATNDRNNNYKAAESNHYNYKQNDYGYKDHGYNDHRYNDRERQGQIDQINRECDQRIYSYRHDRSISDYERNRDIRQAESERSVRIGSFGTGAVIGVTAGLILGAVLSH